jgi:hypothetical protein
MIVKKSQDTTRLEHTAKAVSKVLLQRLASQIQMLTRYLGTVTQEGARIYLQWSETTGTPITWTGRLKPTAGKRSGRAHTTRHEAPTSKK